MRLLLCSLAFAATAAQAAPGYDYLELAAVGVGFRQPGALPDDSATGVRFRSSVAMDDEWYWDFEAGFTKYSGDTGNMWKTGVGYAFPLDWFDLAVQLDYGRIDYGIYSGGGFAWDVELRSVAWDRFELNGHLGQTQVEPIDEYIQYGVGALWQFSDDLGLTVELEQSTGDVVDAYGYAIGVRWSF